MNEITSKQKETLRFISEFIDKNGYAPIRREIASHFDVTKNAIQERVMALQSKRYIDVDYNICRGISVRRKTGVSF